MQFRPSRSDEPELNLVPLIDVLLMTLIFLVVTTSFSKETQLRIKLPEASSETKVQESTIRVLIDAQGNYYLGKRKLANQSADTLRGAMLRVAGKMKDPVIIIHADSKAPHGAVVQVMDSARRLGYSRLTFATQKPANGGSAP